MVETSFFGSLTISLRVIPNYPLSTILLNRFDASGIPPNCEKIVSAEITGPGGLGVTLVESTTQISDYFMAKCPGHGKHSIIVPVHISNLNNNGITLMKRVNIEICEPVFKMKIEENTLRDSRHEIPEELSANFKKV